jgi:hypothetical protein
VEKQTNPRVTWSSSHVECRNKKYGKSSSLAETFNVFSSRGLLSYVSRSQLAHCLRDHAKYNALNMIIVLIGILNMVDQRHYYVSALTQCIKMRKRNHGREYQRLQICVCNLCLCIYITFYKSQSLFISTAITRRK